MAQSPFHPGMDPFLEGAAVGEGFHDGLMTVCAAGGMGFAMVVERQ
jgi:acetyl-CoA acetyltransferase